MVEPVRPCPDEDALDRLACMGEEGLLSAQAEHASRCPTCADRVAEMKENSRLFQELREVLGAPARLPVVPGFSILRRLGRGAMGDVFEAEQDDPRRRVALKVIRRSGLDDAEVRSLVRLRHPNLTPLIGAGYTLDGNRYFAMEMVTGRAIDRHAADESLGIEECVRLFLPVCDAIEHAHRRGVLHGDLKPSNILVDGDSAPRVLDFGLATFDEEPELSVPGGTLPYMSPEHIGGGGDPRDPRRDVYALGVTLYRLVTGALPLDVADLPFVEACAIVCTAAPTPPRSIAPRTPRDLERIILHCLAKRPADRYPTVAALAADLRRFLKREPISIREGTVTYRLVRYAARRPAVAALAGTLLGVVAGGAIAIWSLAEEARASETAELAYKRTLRDMIRELPLEDANESLVYQLDKIAAAARRNSGGSPESEAYAFANISTVLAAIGENERALTAAMRGLSVLESTSDVDPKLIIDALFQIANAHRECGDVPAAIANSERAIERARDAYGRRDPRLAQAVERHVGVLYSLELAHRAAPWIADALQGHEQTPQTRALLLGRVAGSQSHAGRYSAALASVNAALQAARSVEGESAAALVGDLEQRRVGVLLALGRFPEALEGQRALLDRVRRVEGESSATTARVKSALARLFSKWGEHDEAKALLTEALETARAPDLALLQRDLSMSYAVALYRAGEFEPARERFQSLVDELTPTSSLQDATAALSWLSHALCDLEDYAGAVQCMEEVLRRAAPMYGDSDARLAPFYAHMGTAYRLWGRHQDAQAAYEAAMGLFRTHLDQDDARIAWMENNLAMLAWDQGDYVEGERRLLQAMFVQEEQTVALAESLSNLALVYQSAGRPDDAVSPARRSLQIRLRHFAPGHGQIAHTESILGSCLADVGHLEEAEMLLDGAWRKLVASHGDQHRQTREALSRLQRFRALHR